MDIRQSLPMASKAAQEWKARQKGAATVPVVAGKPVSPAAVVQVVQSVSAAPLRPAPEDSAATVPVVAGKPVSSAAVVQVMQSVSAAPPRPAREDSAAFRSYGVVYPRRS